MNKLELQRKIEEVEEQIESLKIPYDYDTKEYPVHVLLTLYNNGEAENDLFIPDYQRNFVWNQKKKSSFIESVLLGVPIQPMFAAEIEGRLELIDGSQRLRTLHEFLNNKFKITGLTKLDNLNGLYYKNLFQSRQRRFKLYGVRIHVVSPKATPEIRRDIFNRINTTGSLLSAAEIRKGTSGGPFYNLILEVSKSEKFVRCCPVSLNGKGKRGEREELALRFFAYSDSYNDVRHDVKDFLDNYTRNMNHNFIIDNAKYSEYSYRLERVLNFVEKFLPTRSFSKSIEEQFTPRVRFEALSVGIHLALCINPDLSPINFSWLDSEDFKSKTTSDASNNPGRLKSRIEFVRDSLLKSI